MKNKQLWTILLPCVLLPTHLPAQTLTEAVSQTMTTNPEMQVYGYRKLAADRNVDQARAGYYPKVDANLGIGYERTNNSSTRPDTVELTRGEAGLNATQMLFDGFRTKNEVDAANARVDEAVNRVASESERLGLAAVTAYMEVLRQDELLQMSDKNIEFHKETYDRIESRSSSGFGSTVDLQQVEGRLAQAESNRLAILQAQKDARANFVRIVGSEPENLSLPKLEDCCTDNIPPTLQLAVDQACLRHPELKAAIANYENSLSRELAEKSRYSPELRLDLEANWDNDLDGVDGTNEDKLAMLRGDYNVYKGGSDQAANRQQQHLSEAAKQQVREIKRQLDRDIRLAWNSRILTGKTLPKLEQRAMAAEETRDSYTEQFRIGQRTLLDLLDTENELFSARSELVNGKYDNHLSEYRLMAAVGVLLQSMDIPVPEVEDMTVAENQ
ncbi:TolC family outer membrane protein [Neptuniibacter halophilus]|uniref:TolC family outer membrane protein n=1 Tax=Neptuniibacter halophilus TaxID=651666 RepID=UPI002573D366|nr:TolC family outer membrane protein [Neptuniibacter halophilus]